MKEAYIYFNYTNKEVLQDYLDIVKKSLEDMGYSVCYTKDLSKVKKNSLIVFPVAYDAFKYYLKGYRNFILWQQGAVADESYMRNSSKLRYHILNIIDVFMMKKARCILYVSEEMRRTYEQRGRCSFGDKSYVMPCFNEEYVESIFSQKNYANKIFTYVGSLAEWQCFDQTIDLYKKIEEKIPQSKIKVLTFEVGKAKSLIEGKGIKNYEVKCVPKEQVRHELIEATYGFIIREDNVVNRVATPTKFSSYIAAGVIPIFSSCIKDFKTLSDNYSYVMSIDDTSLKSVSDIVEFANKNVAKEYIMKEYKNIFETYYNKSLHRLKLAQLFKVLHITG